MWKEGTERDVTGSLALTTEKPSTANKKFWNHFSFFSSYVTAALESDVVHSSRFVTTCFLAVTAG